MSRFQVESNEAEKNPWMVKVTLREKSVFSPNTGKYGPEITPYLETLHAVYYKDAEWRRKLTAKLVKLVKLCHLLSVVLI